MKKTIILAAAAFAFGTLTSCHKSATPKPVNALDTIQVVQTGKTSITVNYGESIDSMLFVDANKFNIGLTDDVVKYASNFELEGGGTKSITVELVSFTRPMNTDTVKLVLAQRKMAAANIQEVISYGNQVLDVSNLPTYLIVCLGTTIPEGPTAGAPILIGNIGLLDPYQQLNGHLVAIGGYDATSKEVLTSWDPSVYKFLVLTN